MYHYVSLAAFRLPLGCRFDYLAEPLICFDDVLVNLGSKWFMTCNKCRQAPRDGSDSWCLGCAAVEQLSTELSLSWPLAGARVLCTDLLVTTLRQVRACRRLGLSVAGSDPASGRGSAAPSGFAEGRPCRSLQPPEPAQPPSARPVEPPYPPGLKNLPPRPEIKEEAILEAEDEYTYTSGEEEVEKPKERSPVQRRRTGGKAPEEGTVRAREERKPGGDYRREERSSRRRERDEAKDKAAGRSDGKKSKKRKRGGRKHQRLYRAQEDPYRSFHRRRGGDYWDRGYGVASKDDLGRLL